MKHILAIDIGSFETKALIANYDKISSNLSISGVGIAPSKGVRKGAITNIDLASKSIKKALNDAKRVAGVEISNATVSISSAYTKSITSFGVINVPSNEISIKEINRVIQIALQTATIPSEYQVLQAIPYNFKVDELDEVEDPTGMSGSRLEVSLHIIIALKSGIENLKKTFKLAGVKIDNIVSSAYASGLAVLKEDEKELGVAVIDMGATTSDIGFFVNSAFRYHSFLGVGSHHITNDLSIALHTPLSDAEYIKTHFEEIVFSGEPEIEVGIIGNEEEKQKVPVKLIVDVVSARLEETFSLLNEKITTSGIRNKIGAGIVLTGGLTNFFNIKVLAEEFFEGLPVRIGTPKQIEGLFDNIKKPEFACVVGLIMYSTKENLTYEIDSNKEFRSKYIEENIFEEPPKKEEEEEVTFEITEDKEEPTLIQKIKTWVSNLF